MLRPTLLQRAILPSRQFASFTRTFATATTPAPTTQTTTPQSEEAPVSPPPERRYIVSRTASKNLAVYHRTKSGGTQKLTEIKKVEGDREALKRKLAEEFRLDEKHVKVKVPTGHIEIKGHIREQVIHWLEKQGF